ncbi:cobalamin binding intrinsic factor-like [Archocentrus centrarchus]|uniref:cobalamin binding intrinsic factor-like n=1 Tax=Archocentrus centrarchus TaxID=63155 RepID=UPI0011EA3C83|nr:cobalamin binding intrinsic factor-like [Archocentrus centrarchus]
MKKPALLPAALLLLLGIFWMSAASSNQTPFSVQVRTPTENKSYKTYAAVNGSLFGGLVRLQQANPNFNFTYTPNDDYGPFLQNVNGLAGDSSHYWQLLSGDTPLNVGMGCYLPNANEVITLKYTKF